MSGCKKIQKDVLVINLLIPLLVGGLSSLLSGNSREFYSTINTPDFAPPGIVFPIVWPILYLLMGISSYIIYTSGSEQTKDAMISYAIQLFFNFAWSIIFFRFHEFGLAFLWLILLWVSILLMIIKFSKINKVAALLQIPYLLWVTFAGVLNLAIFLLN